MHLATESSGIPPSTNGASPSTKTLRWCDHAAPLLAVQWDDVRAFLAVAQSGSLRRAARKLNLAQPTVLRHLRRLEQTVGTRLFERRRDGHRLTRAGHELLPLAQGMADAAATIDRRRVALADDVGGLVRVASGEWCASFLAPRLSPLIGTRADLAIELVETHIDPDLDRREADVFIRHPLPARGPLVRFSLGTMAAAVYGAPQLVETHPAAKTEARFRSCPWVSYDTPHQYFRTMAWLADRVGDRRPRVRASRLSLQLDAIRAGAGLGILPCFIGDADPVLVRLTAPVPDLTADFWLLVHRDMKDVPRVRRVIESVRELFRRETPMLRGRRRK